MDADRAPALPDSSETLVNGLLREWYHEQRIVLYRLTAVSEDIVNRWADSALDTLKSWPRTSPYLAIHDLSHPGVSLQYAALVSFDMMNIGVTLEGRFATDALFEAEPLWSAKVAILFNLSLSGQTNRTLLGFLNKENPAVRYKTFYHRGKALRWLLGKDATDTGEMRSIRPTD